MTYPNHDQLKTRLQKVDGYRCTDGVIKTELAEAVRHENELDFRAWATGILTEQQIDALLHEWEVHRSTSIVKKKDIVARLAGSGDTRN